MANPTCNATTWITNAASYQQAALNRKFQHGLRIHAKALQLAAIGGSDYTADLNSLVEASEVLAGGMSDDQVMAASIAIGYANAVSAGAVEPNLTNKLEAIKSIVLHDEHKLCKAELLLDCELGRAKAYPQ